MLKAWVPFRKPACGQSRRLCGQQRMAEACQSPTEPASSLATCRTPCAPLVTSLAASTNCCASLLHHLLSSGPACVWRHLVLGAMPVLASFCAHVVSCQRQCLENWTLLVQAADMYASWFLELPAGNSNSLADTGQDMSIAMSLHGKATTGQTDLALTPLQI